MTKIKQFAFNPYQVNSYVVSDDSNECIIIDGACSTKEELERLDNYIKEYGLTPVLLVNTHAHIDHVVGNHTLCKFYNIPLAAHAECNDFLTHALIYAKTFGVEMEAVKPIDFFLSEDKPVTFGQSSLKVFETPGHADGSVCFYSAQNSYVVTGDVLFRESIGRTDLKTGDYDLLQKSIWEKLFTLPDETDVLPGHGPKTTIGHEKENNPFVAIGME